jgi:DNA-binding transcriptional MerR regulator
VDTEFNLKIGEVARMLSISDQTVRNYESRGWLHAGRLPSGQRVFSMTEVEKLRDHIMRSGRKVER